MDKATKEALLTTKHYLAMVIDSAAHTGMCECQIALAQYIQSEFSDDIDAWIKTTKTKYSKTKKPTKRSKSK